MVYEPQELEKGVLRYWKKEKTHEKLRKKTSKGKKFFYLDGPPYVSGSPHPGLGWNRAYKDIVRRYYWKKGMDVWDQPGFDCHGLPIEHAVEKELGLKNKQGIAEYGANRFIAKCKSTAKKNQQHLADVFERIGEWADWKNPYLTLNDRYIESVWWGISECWKKGLVYEGLKALTWCPRCGTALAGNYEVVHKTVRDNSVYLKFPIKGKDKEFLIVWTTTPWTIPFNMAVMVHPELEYVKAQVDDEKWVMALGLAGSLMSIMGKPLEIAEKMTGEQLEGVEYWHPFYTEIPNFSKIKSKWMHKIVLSKEYVNLSAGTGLVHCAPGCGPEDFEVGQKYKIYPFNNLDENGVFKDVGNFDGMTAKKDDAVFIRMLKDKGVVVREVEIEHEYPMCERCDTPVVFRTTRQWFLNVTKFKGKMLKESKKVVWVPEWAGANQFANWLENIKDWCLTRQRFWGIPFPMWKCEKCGKIRFISGKKELKKKIPELHKPYIDEVTLKCGCGGEMRRSEDVIDVWMDAASAPFASLGYPADKKTFERLFPADMIIEAKDQIRGWFYGLIALSTILFSKSPFKRVYMHGWLNDENNIGMSKRLGNYVELDKIIDKFGADIFRLTMISNTNPGLDVRYEEKSLKEGYKLLNVLWNTHMMLLKTSRMMRYTPKRGIPEHFEDKWIISKVNSLVRQSEECMEKMEINELPKIISSFILEDFSRWYLKLVRSRLFGDDKKSAKSALDSMQYTLEILANIFSPVVPFITEKIYRNITKEESVHLKEWPQVGEIDKKLEDEMETVRKVVQAGLYLRDTSKTGIRWPLKRLMIKTSKRDEIARHREIIKEQLNVKEIEFIDEHLAEFDFKFNYPSLKRFGKHSATIIAKLMSSEGKGIKEKSEKGFSVEIGQEKFSLNQNDFVFTPKLPEGLKMTENPVGSIYLDCSLSSELEQEGYAREMIRRIQQERKANKLEREDFISVRIRGDTEDIAKFKDEIEGKTNSRIEFGEGSKEFRIRDKTFFMDISAKK